MRKTSMTRIQHLEEYRRHNELAVDHLLKANAGESFDYDEYALYKSEAKRANKHHGIASMMWTKEYKKLRSLHE